MSKRVVYTLEGTITARVSIMVVAPPGLTAKEAYDASPIAQCYARGPITQLTEPTDLELIEINE